MSQTPVLSDGNILLRTFRAEDINALYEAARESINEISPWLPWCHANYSIEESTSFIMSREEAWKSEGEYAFAILDAKTGMFLGCVGLNQFNRDYQYCNLGYWVRASCTGRGIASAAARLAARFGLEELKLQRIEIVAAVGNRASQRAAEKTGAKREGVVRKRLLIHDQPLDAVLFSIVAEDFNL
jgi:ribosomal-protein-serine acetyltransferase